MKYIIAILLFCVASTVSAKSCDRESVGRHVAVAAGSFLVIGAVAGTAVALAIPVGTAAGPTVLASVVAGSLTAKTAAMLIVPIAAATGIISSGLAGTAVALTAIERCI